MVATQTIWQRRPNTLRIKIDGSLGFGVAAKDIILAVIAKIGIGGAIGYGIETLIITGTGTGVCCESTARDAMMLNFATIMVSDGNACETDEEHNASLSAIYRNFGDVMTTEEVVGYVQANRVTPANAAE